MHICLLFSSRPTAPGRRGRRPLQSRGVVRFPGWPGGSLKVRRGEGTPPYGAGIRFVTVVGGGVLDAPHGCYGTPWAAIYGFRAS